METLSKEIKSLNEENNELSKKIFKNLKNIGF